MYGCVFGGRDRGMLPGHVLLSIYVLIHSFPSRSPSAPDNCFVQQLHALNTPNHTKQKQHNTTQPNPHYDTAFSCTFSSWLLLCTFHSIQYPFPCTSTSACTALLHAPGLFHAQHSTHASPQPPQPPNPSHLMAFCMGVRSESGCPSSSCPSAPSPASGSSCPIIPHT